MTTSTVAVRSLPLAGHRDQTGILGLIPLLKSHRTLLILTVALCVLAQAATVASLVVGARLAGLALTGGQLLPTTVILSATVVVTAAARWLHMYVAHDMAYALVETLQLGVFDGLERAAPAEILGRRSGELASIAATDASLAELFYAHMLGDYVSAIVVPLGALVCLAFVHWAAALALLPFLPLLASIPLWLGRRADAQGRLVSEAIGTLNGDVVETIQGLRELVIFGQVRSRLQRLMAQAGLVAHAQRRYGTRSGLEHAANDFLLAGAVLVTISVGVLLVKAGHISIDLLPMIIVLPAAAMLPIAEVTRNARNLGEVRAAATRVLAIFHQKSRVRDEGQAEPMGGSEIRFERVEFSYDRERKVLRDVSFSVAPGETVALVGRSGAGKTSCVNLLMRFWDPLQGRITIGGIDIRAMPISVLRSLVAVVPQDVHLFDASIADNIRLGRPDASAEAVREAARLAQADQFISTLPDGYETQCGERGARLSGGQRQRIAIARAFLRDAPILVMDEAVSNLDTENEHALQAAIAQLQRDRTVLIVAHRPSTIRSADRIIVLEDGAVTEHGRHEDLVGRGGAYARFLATAEAEVA
ncbi:ABC transporter ATP-binding protein [Taklimakanibacter lacteus]|uniref:ABC transporter ATP-binding protein n=1 Tax=Taklimakanibacter lacteus TaxID=2268456 RepID=UPI000E675A5C